MEEIEMYTLLQAISIKQLLLEQLPVLMVSLLFAELFYKFHSFTLEAVAFLGTWFLIDAAVTATAKVITRRNQRR
jgi:hypothetical protein